MTDPNVLAASANSWGERPHLDGLRAVAVYLVVLFHADLTSFEGGFVGVDLFFVLSGFLVTNVVLTDLHRHGRLRLVRFYARRARRLIPAATLAVVGTSLIAVLVATRIDRAPLVGDARAASLWFANWHFIAQSEDYFRADDLESPFLHFWSLAIEEQFYIAFPMLVIAVWRIGRGQLTRMIAVFTGLLVLATAVQFYWASRDSNRAYLGTDARAYQLLLGVVLALVLWHVRLPRRLRSPARIAFPAAVGVMVLCGTSLVDLSASHRGVLAGLASVATILAAEAADGGRFASTLGSAPLRYLGNISYGTYLWHWPVLVLATRVVELTPLAAFALSATIGTALAALSFALVEQPVRSGAWIVSRQRTAIAGGVALAVLSGIVVAPNLLESDRRPSVVAVGGGAGTTPLPDLDWESIDLDPPDVPPCAAADGSDCIVTEGGGETMLLVGDSHARMYLPALEQIATERGLRLAVAWERACPWPRSAYTGDRTERPTRACIELRQRTYDSIIPSLQPSIIVAVGRANYVGRLGRLATTRADLGDTPHEELFEEMADATIDEWVRDGRQVVLIEPIAEFERASNDPVSCLSGARSIEQCTFPALLSSIEEDVLRRAAERHDGVTSIDFDGLKCPGLVVCPPIIDGIVVNRDQSHLSNAFVLSIAAELERRMVEAGALPPR